MAILNVTPDSYFTSYFDRDSVKKQSKVIFDSGADIIDVGAESTRPFSTYRTTPDEEIERLY